VGCTKVLKTSGRGVSWEFHQSLALRLSRLSGWRNVPFPNAKRSLGDKYSATSFQSRLTLRKRRDGQQAKRSARVMGFRWRPDGCAQVLPGPAGVWKPPRKETAGNSDALWRFHREGSHGAVQVPAVFDCGRRDASADSLKVLARKAA